MTASHGRAGKAGRQALVIAYNFPPDATIGTMRSLRLIRRLREDGWDVTVLAGHPATYLSGTAVEPSLETRIPAGVRVLRVRAFRPFDAAERLARRSRTRTGNRRPSHDGGVVPVSAGRPARSSVMRSVVAVRDLVEAVLDIPDKESGWIAPAVVRGLRHVLTHGRPDVIYSSAPPWSAQVVGLVLATACRRPWAADFRDPWARAPWRDWRRRFRQRAAASLERQVIGRASAALFVTRANLADFSQLYETRAARFHCVPNGCDPSEMEGLAPLPPRERFVLLHAGTLYGARTPLPVMRAIASAAAGGTLDRERFRLRLLGNVSLDTDLVDECRRLRIDDLVELVPRVTREDSLREMQSASALLLIQTGTTLSVPGKAYEYLAAGRPVLALADEGETSALIRASGAGVAVRPDEPVAHVEAALQAVMSMASRPFRPAAPQFFDGRVHAGTAVQILSALAAEPGRPAVRAAGPVLPEPTSVAPREETVR
jgi:glycosyltransferase involved in cell wall biosynthesis